MTARAFVANELRRARETKKLSRAKLADEIFVSE
jgi:ribosome-binding protein aMBF1 (putative translation factor)